MTCKDRVKDCTVKVAKEVLANIVILQVSKCTPSIFCQFLRRFFLPQEECPLSSAHLFVHYVFVYYLLFCLIVSIHGFAHLLIYQVLGIH